MTGANEEKSIELTQIANQTLALHQAAALGDVEAGARLVFALFQRGPEARFDAAGPEELEVFLVAHEVLDSFLRGVVFADGASSRFAQTLTFPKRGAFPAPIPMANARWLRIFGSSLLDNNEEQLTAELLAGQSMQRQATLLGRYCSVNDGARMVDYDAIMDVIDPRLHAVFAHWLIGVALCSPGNLSTEAVARNQREMLAAFVARHRHDTKRLASSALFSHLPFMYCYRADIDVRPLAEILTGRMGAHLIAEARGHGSDPSEGEIAKRVPRGGRVIVCPNWTETHVAFRCLSEVAEHLRTPDTRVIMFGDGKPERPPAPGWEAQTLRFPIGQNKHYMGAVAGLARELKQRDLELAFFPEVAPTNATIYLATQRIARVQAAGYGFPIATGSPAMDYMFVGSDVEGPESNYNETPFVIPGLGVSTTAPPRPSRGRERDADDTEVRAVTVSTWQKLTPPLVRAWEAIFGDKPNARLDAYTSTFANRCALMRKSAAPFLDKARVKLLPALKRDVLLCALEDADVYLDTFPYGGFNSLVEVFCAGVPVLTLEGPEARHRFGAAMIRRLGLPELLIAKSPDEFIATARRLIEEPALRAELRAQIGTRERVLEALGGAADMHDLGARIDAVVQAAKLRQAPAA